MHKEQLFDHKKLQLYSLLLLLHLHNNHASKSKLCSVLKITSPTLNQLTEHINSFDSQILTTTRHEVILNLPYSSQPITTLNHQILTSSLRFQLLDIYFKYSRLSREEIADLLNISLSSTNTLISECNKFLAEFSLEIKQGMLRGSGLQYFYFYFYWSNYSNGIIKDQLMISDHGFKEFAAKRLGSKLNIIQTNQISLWLTLLSFKHELLPHHLAQVTSTKLWAKVKETALYRALCDYFRQNWPFLERNVSDYCSYLTFIFLNTHSILNYPVTEINSGLSQTNTQQLLTQITTILTNSYNFSDDFFELQQSLYYTINKFLLLDGYYYTDDLLSLESQKSSIQPFEEKVIDEILHIPLVQNFKLSPDKQAAIRENLKLIICPYKNQKRYQIKIGVVSQLTISSRHAYIAELKTLLNKGHNIDVSDYTEEKHYDLIVSDFDFNVSIADKPPILLLDDLTIKDNITRLEHVVAQIEGESFQSLLLK
ncbi:helix-turn-helix domain-containing protein [Ligilactobacillus apodemi]|uniref:Mga helix-turn-helix domain-containing protein n=1 Tax=Ligilactobacillus apodemi DSM 16634 = JCM 16172 TaxID=1423724 RepID=A0A0R1U816_9LACO|nr:helix-turn-helix domain-containing protein [Ligilactobacillus apodemi]KRL87173.1 hypothetical protein FC32_GL001791 [Ligilactobacillus apodemi DSM 16634 = JCM 16172]